MTKQPALYTMASKRKGTLYIGVTSNLQQRVWQHKNNAVPGFTRKYDVHLLVYYELYGDRTGKDIKKMASGMENQPD